MKPPVSVGKRFGLVGKFFRKMNRRLIAVAGIGILLLVILPSSILAYSWGLKYQGDIEYKNQNYAGAMDKYQRAKSYWFLGAVSSRLKDRDLETKIGKADVMTRSDQNYQDGIKEFESGDFDSAKYYFQE